MKKLIVFVMFFVNFVIVQGTLNVNYSEIVKVNIYNQELSIWFALLAFGVFGLFSLEIFKGKKKGRSNKIDYIA